MENARVLILQPDPRDPPALIGECLASRNVEYSVRRVDLGESVTDADMSVDGLVILGGPQSIFEEPHADLAALLTDTIHRFHGTGKPILGICLGGQAIAQAFGARVRRVGELQFGFLSVRLETAARDDLLLSDQADECRVFCWHEDCFTLPEGAVRLATTDRVADYAFRIDRSVYAFQCHFEVTHETLKHMLERGRHLVPKNLGERGQALLAAIDDEIEAHLGAANRFGETVADRWIDLVLDGRRRPYKTAAATSE